MLRDEKELLNSLVKILSGETTQTNKITNDENETIEKYRDKDGFINLTKVKDNDEITKVVKIVDKKNYMESLLSEKDNMQILADKLAEELFSSTDVKNIDVKINVGNNTNDYHFSKYDEMTENKETCSNKNTECSNKNETLCFEEDKNDEVITEKPKSVVLYNVGGTYNPMFYNAVRYICEEKYFSEDGVYSEFDTHPIDENIDVCILLPNIWGKIVCDAIEDFAEYMENGAEIFVINPETFELTQITESAELWDYEMSELQEEHL